jgi:hypothetical protein
MTYMVKNVFNVIHFNRHAYILLKDDYLPGFCNSVHFSKRCSVVTKCGDGEQGVVCVLFSEQGEWQVVI